MLVTLMGSVVLTLRIETFSMAVSPTRSTPNGSRLSVNGGTESVTRTADSEVFVCDALDAVALRRQTRAVDASSTLIGACRKSIRFMKLIAFNSATAAAEMGCESNEN